MFCAVFNQIKNNNAEVENRGHREMRGDDIYKDFPQVPI